MALKRRKGMGPTSYANAQISPNGWKKVELMESAECD
jgi:hypothetical protein